MASEVPTPNDVLSEIQGIIRWPQFGLVLDIEKEIIEKTAQQFGGDEQRALRHIVTHWLDNDHDASWEKLAKAIMRIPMLREKGAQLYTKYVSKDLTTDTICKELEDLVQDWFQLGYMFLTNSQRVREAGTGDSNEDKKRNVIDKWLKFDPLASWESVARRIEDCLPQHEAYAEQIRKKYLPEIDNTPLIKPPSPAPETELDVKTAFKATQGVDDWYALGWFLKLKQEELIDIEEQHTRPDQRRNAVLQLWLEKYPISADWIDLANALQHMPQHVGKSNTIRTKYCKISQMTEQPLAEELGQTEIDEEQHSQTSEKLLAQSSDMKELESELKSTKEELADVEKMSLLKTREIESLESESKMTQGKTGQIMELPLAAATEKLGQVEEQPSNTREKFESISTQPGDTKELESELKSTKEDLAAVKKVSVSKTREIESLKSKLMKMKESIQHDEPMEIDYRERTESGIDIQEEEIGGAKIVEQLQHIVKGMKSTLNSTEDRLMLLHDHIIRQERQLQEKDQQMQDLKNTIPSLPAGLMNSMEIIGKCRGQFTSDETYSMNESKYGFRLHIPKGSIPEKATGVVDICVIHSGPFQFRPDSSPVSSIYYIKFSHDLIKSITLELQHCCTITSEEDAKMLSFAYASASNEPPYKFQPLEGGDFYLESNYGTIRRSSFSFIIVDYLTRLLKWPLSIFQKKQSEPDSKKRKRDSEEIEYKDLRRAGLSYLLLHKPNSTKWTASISVIQDLNTQHEFNLKNHKGDVVDHKVKPIDLREDCGLWVTVTHEVAKEKDERSYKEVQLEKWNGELMFIASKWQIYADNTDITLDDIFNIFKISKTLFPNVEINIKWSGKLPMEEALLKIHIVNLKKPLCFSADLPSHSVYRTPILSNSNVDFPEDLVLTDPPELDVLMDYVIPNVQTKWDFLAIRLIHQTDIDSIDATDQDVKHKCLHVFRRWLQNSRDPPPTWIKLINALKNRSVGEQALAQDLEEHYNCYNPLISEL